MKPIFSLGNVLMTSCVVPVNWCAILLSQLECLSKAGIQIERVPGHQEIFSPNNQASNPFEHVLTKHKQMRFFKDEFSLIVSTCAF